MEINEHEMYKLIGSLQRLQLQDATGPIRYAITRNLQILSPFLEATLIAFPEPLESEERKEWTKILEQRKVEFTPVLFPFAPEVDDKVFVMEQKEKRKNAKEGDPEKDWTDEQLEFDRILRNQTIMDSIIILIKE